MSMKPQWVLATHNAGKLREFAEMTSDLPILLRSAGELHLPEPEENGDTYEANALIKAEAACTGSGLPSIADDSGLSVDALDGAPGIYSARWAGPTKDFSIAMLRVKDELAAKNINIEGAKAHFVCVIAVARPGKASVTFRGEVHGHLTYPPRGNKGFGYNPIFIADGFTQTFAEMDDEARYSITHRKHAFDQFTAWLRTNLQEAA